MVRLPNTLSRGSKGQSAIKKVEITDGLSVLSSGFHKMLVSQAQDIRLTAHLTLPLGRHS